MVIKNLRILALSLIIFSLPFMQFILNNVEEINVIVGKSFYFLIFFLFLIIIFFSFIINKLKINIYLVDKLFIITLIFWVFFNHNFLKSLINKFSENNSLISDYSSESSLVILILISILFSIQVLKKNTFLIRFFFIFFSLSFFFILFKILSHEEIKSENLNIYQPQIIFEDKAQIKKNNIYFFILDGMQPLNDFEDFYKINLQNYLLNYEKNEFNYIHNTESLHSSTTYSLSSMFYLDNVSVESKNIPFPVVMRSKIKPDLIYNLDNLGYDFKWIGNFFAYCPKYNLKYCLDKKKEPIIDNYLYINFFRQTPLIQIIINFGHIINFDFNRHFFFKLNDGIGRLIKNIESNKNFIKKPTFYFIHHMSPHWPYITNNDCSYKYFEGKKNYEGYKSAYLCVLKKIENVVNYLKISDPNAFVIFQSDHNWKLSNNDESDHKKIFNLVKLNNCKIEDKINLHNVNLLRLVFSCITGNNPEYLNY